MRELKHLFEKNRVWAEERVRCDPSAFLKQAEGQSPPYLWIGCSDSRIPANEIVGLPPGELFVHRNIANIVAHTDLNVLSVLEYGIHVLGVEHVIVCGHYGCGGVKAAMEERAMGLLDHWLRPIRDLYVREKREIDRLEEGYPRWNRLVERNVLCQVLHVCHTSIVDARWKGGFRLCIHGWVYDLHTGLLRDLDCCISSIEQIQPLYETLRLV